MVIVKNGDCGKWRWWKMKIVETENYGNCGKWKLWKKEIVENENCGMC